MSIVTPRGAAAADRAPPAVLGRHVRLQLSRVEGELLSAEAVLTQDVAVLRRAVPLRGDSTTRSTGCRPRSCWRGGRRRRLRSFTFTLKAPRRITHDARLRGCDDLVATFCEAARTLGSKLAVLLFQLPPSLKKDLPLIDAFLSSLPGDLRAAFEFRHASWHDDAVFDRLRAQGAALCIADSEKLTTPAVATAPHGYFRLRDEGYDDADLARWAGTMQGEAGWQDVFVYFKHEAAGRGPALAAQLAEILSAT